MTEPFTMFLSYYDMQCTPASVEPVLDIKSCVAMKQTVIRPLALCHCMSDTPIVT